MSVRPPESGLAVRESDSGGAAVLDIRGLGPAEARRLTDEVKADVGALRQKLLRLYEGEAHLALGYASWQAYWQVEFETSWQTGYRELDAARVDRAVLPWANGPLPERQAREFAPLLKEDEKALIETWRDLKEQFGDDLTAVNVRQVVANRVQRIRREKAAVDEGPPPEPGGGMDIRHGNFREAGLERQSVDLVFTDPPYPGEFLHEWEGLARFAAEALKPGKLLVAYSGQYHLPEVMYALNCELEYVWMGALVTPGAHNQVQQRHIRSAAKPLLFYSAGTYEPGPWIDDSYVSEQRSKDDHVWQQSLGAATYFIERLTGPGDLVADPFLGSGTTAVACRDLGRRFVGCDVDEAAVTTAKRRLAA